jgi:hypothetical protein
MAAMQIGSWVRRSGKNTKWHLVESIVAGDAFTRCGRRLRDPDLDVSGFEVLTRAIGQPQNCRYCDPLK